MVSDPTSHIQDAELIVPSEQRVQHRVGGRVGAEQTVGAAEVLEGPRQTGIGNGKVVHPFRLLQTTRQVREGEGRWRHYRSTRASV
jgi:hypothetical protein